MRLLILALILVFRLGILKAQDNCSSAVTLCANSLITRTTQGATPGLGEVMPCGDNTVNNNVWFTVVGINNGNCTVRVTNIDNNPGLEMAVFTGTCSSFTYNGQCATGSGSTGRAMSVTFPTTVGTTYYIMVDGSGGNAEAFDIIATSSANNILARPDANFITNPTVSCTPAVIALQNTSAIFGGTNITYDWSFDGGSLIRSTGRDTSVTFTSIGTHTVSYRVCNNECGCKTNSQDVVVQNLVPTISYSPTVSCIGTKIFFNGAASIQPNPPFTEPNVTFWKWDFGDPASGLSNTATGQFASHVFKGNGPDFTVRLIVDGLCGPDTVTTTITLLPKPQISVTGPAAICEGTDLNYSATVSNVTNPVTYNWTGAGIFSCTNCPATTISSLPAGGPYSIIFSLIDSKGCIADTTMNIVVNELPVVYSGGYIQVCPSDSAVLNTFVFGGTAPYQYQWSPSAGLSSDTVAAPVTFNTTGGTYCVNVTDANGCASFDDCVIVDQFPKPSINPSVATLCATDPNRNVDLTLTGQTSGSVISWGFSPSYTLISSALTDSSTVTVTFPSIAGSYNYIAVVNDVGTGCLDTVQYTFTVTPGLNIQVSGPTRFCIGDSVTLTASGATTYAWSSLPAYSLMDSTAAAQVVSPSVTTVFTIAGTTAGCSQVVNYNLTANPKPTALINPIPDFCGCTNITLNGSLSTLGMVYAWTSQSGSLITNGTQIIASANVCATDSFTLSVTDPVSGCFTTAGVSAAPKSKPAAAFSLTPNLICNGVLTTIILDGTGSNTSAGTTYTWTANDPSVVIASPNSLTTTANVTTTTVFTLRVSDILGCDSVISDTVRVQPFPVITRSNTFICTTDLVRQSTLTISGAGAGSTYNWTSIPSCTTPNSATGSSQLFDFSTCSAGSYIFNVTVTDGITGCVTPLATTVNIVNGITLAVSSDTSICEGGVVTLAASGANTYVWNSGQTADTITVAGLTSAASPYNFIVAGTAGSCISSDTIIVTVNPVPSTSVISGPATICVNDSSATYSVNPASGNYTWNITGGAILSGQSSNTITVVWNTPGSGILTVADTNSFGCPGPIRSLNVLVSQRPDTVVIIGNASVCENGIEQYFILPNAGSTYSWSVTGGAFISGSTGTSVTVQWTTPGQGTIFATEINASNCSGPLTTYNVIINPRPALPVITGSSTVCDNVSDIYILTPYTVGSTYNWFTTNAGSAIINTRGDSLIVTWGNSGTGVVSAFETNNFGCSSDTATFTVNISAHPIALIIPDSATICNNSDYQLLGIANSSFVNWSTDGAGTFNDSTIAMPIYTPAPSDTGYIHLTMVVSNSPCASDTAVIVLYISASPVVSLSSAQGTICFGGEDTLTVTGGGSYIWSPGGMTDSVIHVAPTTTTTYTVVVINNAGCRTTDSTTITVIPPGIPNPGGDQQICNGDTVRLSSSPVNANTVLWTTNGDGTFYPDNAILNPLYIPGPQDTLNRTVSIYITTTGACYNFIDTTNIIINLIARIQAGNDTTLSGSASSNIQVPLPVNGVNISGIQWTTTGTGTFSPNDTSLNAVYIPSAEDFRSDSVVLTVTTLGLCYPALDRLVIDFTPFIIPNVFTPYPSSPGYNDFFVIKNLPEGSKLVIFNRWGSQVYYSEDYRNNWDAYGLEGETFYYVLETNERSYKGYVTVLRE